MKQESYELLEWKLSRVFKGLHNLSESSLIIHRMKHFDPISATFEGNVERNKNDGYKSIEMTPQLKEYFCSIYTHECSLYDFLKMRLQKQYKEFKALN